MWRSDRVGDVVILVHAHSLPEPEHLATTLKLLEGATGCIAFAYGDSKLSASHRKDLATAFSANGVVVAAVMENALQRSIATAVGWFVAGLRVFSPHANGLAEAYQHVGVAGGSAAELIVRLHREVGLPAPECLPSAAEGIRR